MLHTEFEFTMPYGFVDEKGDLHRRGTMRLATALDEVEPLLDPRVKSNEAYLGIILLSRVITRLGSVYPVTTSVIERLFSADFSYLQDLYVRVNDASTIIETECPHCNTRFSLDLAQPSNEVME